jgi:hypothetical protein
MDSTEEFPIASELSENRELLKGRLDQWRATPWRPSDKAQRDQALVEIRSLARELTVALDRAKEEFERSEVEKREKQTSSTLAQVRELEERLEREQKRRQVAEDTLTRQPVERESTDFPKTEDNARQPEVADVQKKAEPHADSTVVDAVADHLWNMTGVYKCYLLRELPLLTANVENPDNLAQLLRTEEVSFTESHRHVKNLTIKHSDAVRRAIQFQAGYALPSSLHTELCDTMASSLDLDSSGALTRVLKLAQKNAKVSQ